MHPQLHYRTMLFKHLNAREAVQAGTALADRLRVLALSGAGKREGPGTRGLEKWREFLRRASHEISIPRLNFYRRVRFANAFKWRLLENGVDRGTADDVTQTLVLSMSLSRTHSAVSFDSPSEALPRSHSKATRNLVMLAEECFARGEYSEAVTHYEELVRLHPRRADVLNDLGAALCKLGRYSEAENCFRKSIARKPNAHEAHGNLGAVHLWRGHFNPAETSMRRALQLQPGDAQSRSNLGLTLTHLGRLREAKDQFEQALKLAPRHGAALYGLGLLARIEGRFGEAESLFRRALETDPEMPNAWAALASLRRMQSRDGPWLDRAEQIAKSQAAPVDEAAVRFAIGKYFDDVQQFDSAFRNYKRANELLQTVAEKYQPVARSRWINDLVRVHTGERISRLNGGTSDSVKPVFVVGMMRSGTSLAEQIIASHPAAAGAGELLFWNDAARKYAPFLRRDLLGEAIRRELGEAYLRILQGHSAEALRIVDKAPVNSDYLGLIHSVFPNARIVHMRRDPIDTCLSCYFQQFSPSMSFTMDLCDLAHYYREHHRLMSHWRTVLPPGTVLEVPYEALVADQEGWTRKILDFLGLDWDARCLNFHASSRPVVTASYWQVRQRIYPHSVGRWRNYRKFIGPLLNLSDLDQ